jgi:hypothetical protein
MKHILAIVLVALSFQVKAGAQTVNADDMKSINTANEYRAMQAALDARNAFVNALLRKDYVAVTHDAFQHAIEGLVEEMASRNDQEMATELQTLWNDNESMFYSLAFTDLGDHAPLFKWLDAYMDKMASKYGSVILSLPIVADLRMLNYAIPVVFSPRGSWQQSGVDSRIEYRKHFIPFANLVTYYAANYGCVYFAKKYQVPMAKQICGKVADKLKFAMGRYIAPVVSDWIFKAANRSLSITNSQLRYVTPGDLAKAIQQN